MTHNGLNVLDKGDNLKVEGDVGLAEVDKEPGTHVDPRHLGGWLEVDYLEKGTSGV